MNKPCPAMIILTIEIPTYPSGGPDGWQRLRRLLKCLIRAYGLRCRSINEPGDTSVVTKQEDENYAN